MAAGRRAGMDPGTDTGATAESEPGRPARRDGWTLGDGRVSVELRSGVATVTLCRPQRHNAIDPEMLAALAACGELLRDRSDLRAVVLTGAGKSFCSGLDFPAFLGAGRAADAGTTLADTGASATLAELRDALAEPPPNRFQQAACVWLELPVPVIAALRGSCVGGGLQIALAADLRIAAADTRLSLMEARWGLVPDMGATRTLPRLVGIDIAKELAYTARVVEAQEALRLGLVTRLAEDPLAAALALADEIASRSPEAMRAAKRLFDEGWDGSPVQTLALEALLQRDLLGSPNQLAAMAAALSGQRPVFTDPGRAAGQGLEP